MLGAAKDGNVKLFIVKVLILSIVICQRRPTPGLPLGDT